MVDRLKTGTGREPAGQGGDGDEIISNAPPKPIHSFSSLMLITFIRAFVCVCLPVPRGEVIGVVVFWSETCRTQAEGV